MARNYMAVDQHGRTFHNLGPHPRKELMERVGCKHATKMYVDRIEAGTGVQHTYHCGWVLAGLWLTVYEVVPMEVEVGRGR